MSTRASESSGLPPELKCKYAVSRTLGSGACGEVKMIFSKIGCKKFALKTITKNKFLTDDKRHPFSDPDKILNEVNILKALRHVSNLLPCLILEVTFIQAFNTQFFSKAMYNKNGGNLGYSVISLYCS